MQDVVNQIANPKGWTYQRRRYAKHERKYGYVFVATDTEGTSYRCVLKADNPIDAASRLRSIDEWSGRFLNAEEADDAARC